MGLPIVIPGGGKTTSHRHPAAGNHHAPYEQQFVQQLHFSGLVMATTAPALVNQYVQHVMPSCMPQGAYQPILPLQFNRHSIRDFTCLRLLCVLPCPFSQNVTSSNLQPGK